MIPRLSDSFIHLLQVRCYYRARLFCQVLLWYSAEYYRLAHVQQTRKDFLFYYTHLSLFLQIRFFVQFYLSFIRFIVLLCYMFPRAAHTDFFLEMFYVTCRKSTYCMYNFQVSIFYCCIFENFYQNLYRIFFSYLVLF